MTDLTAITTPFGLLDRETQEALKAHGGPYEWFADDNGWIEWVPNWDWPFTYRVKPAPPKPREFWIAQNAVANFAYEGRDAAMEKARTMGLSAEIIRVREVLE